MVLYKLDKVTIRQQHYNLQIMYVKFIFFCVSDILKIDNLWCFTNLTKLQLDNNIIEKIEGLDLLTNLVWLGKRQSIFSNTVKVY